MLLLEEKIQGWKQQQKLDMTQGIFSYLITPLGLLLLPNSEARGGIPNIILSPQRENTMSVLLGKSAFPLSATQSEVGWWPWPFYSWPNSILSLIPIVLPQDFCSYLAWGGWQMKVETFQVSPYWMEVGLLFRFIRHRIWEISIELPISFGSFRNYFLLSLCFISSLCRWLFSNRQCC